MDREDDTYSATYVSLEILYYELTYPETILLGASSERVRV